MTAYQEALRNAAATKLAAINAGMAANPVVKITDLPKAKQWRAAVHFVRTHPDLTLSRYVSTILCTGGRHLGGIRRSENWDEVTCPKCLKLQTPCAALTATN